MSKKNMSKEIVFNKKELLVFLEENNAPVNVMNAFDCLSESYEKVCIQNNARETLIKNMEERLLYYSNLETKSYEALNTLKSERQANEILTNEVEQLEDEITALKKQIKELKGK